MEKTRPPGHQVVNYPRKFVTSPRQLFNSSIPYYWWSGKFFSPIQFFNSHRQFFHSHTQFFNNLPDHITSGHHIFFLLDNFPVLLDILILPDNFSISPRQKCDSPVYKFQVHSEFWFFSMPRYDIYLDDLAHLAKFCPYSLSSISSAATEVILLRLKSQNSQIILFLLQTKKI